MIVAFNTQPTYSGIGQYSKAINDCFGNVKSLVVDKRLINADYPGTKYYMRYVPVVKGWRENGLKKIDLKFKDGSKCSGVPLGAAWTLVRYYYWSHKLGSYNKQDLMDLDQISQYVYKRIEETYDQWPRGGWGMQGTHGILYALIRHYKPEHLLECPCSSKWNS